MRALLPTAFALAALVASSAPAQAGWRIDGNQWRDSYSDLSRVAVVQGFVEGFSQAQLLAPFYICVGLKLPTSADCFQKGDEALSNQLPRFDGLTYGQLRDGLNAFYADYRNRKIELPGAMSYVVKAIRGESAQDLEKMAENLRKFAPK